MTFADQTTDVKAAARSAGNQLSFDRIAVSTLTVVIAVIWLIGAPHGRAVWALGIMLGACALTTVALWSSWRYRLYVLSVLFVVCAVSSGLAGTYSQHSIPGWIFTLGLPLFLSYWALRYWKRAVAANVTGVSRTRISPLTPD
jgi:uncharacterized membrane protein YjdF